MNAVLIVEDDRSLRLSLSMLLRSESYRVSEAERLGEALAKIENEVYDVLVTDLKLQGGSGIDLLNAVKRISPRTEVIVITGYGSVPSAVEAMRLGAFYYLAKPFESDELLITIDRALERGTLLREVRHLRGEIQKRYNPEGLVARSPKMQQVLEMASRVARTDATVLIQGESGTGKEVVATAIHAWSHRANGPLIPIDCATLPEGLLESELFGHVKGAFTGALTAKKGLFEEGTGGTVFLDEVGTMPPSTQVKLLRVLQDRTIRRVGGTTSIKIDVRILAASNHVLKSLVEKGAFRDDLYYRLSGIELTIPPLRERKEDIVALVEHFLKRFRRRVGMKVKDISSEAMEALLRHPWPGNVRELEKALEHAVVLGLSDHITLDDLHPRLLGQSGFESSPPKGRLSLAEMEKAHILAVLYEHDWNQRKAAEELDISRTTLWRKLKEYGIKIPE